MPNAVNSLRHIAVAVAAASSLLAAGASAQQSAVASAAAIEEVFVFAECVVFGNNQVTESMVQQQSPITSVMHLSTTFRRLDPGG